MSDRALRNTMTAIAVLGLGVASYLTIVHYTGGTTVCLSHGGCETVQHSVYSKVAGIPVALLGLIGYVLILISLRLPTSETTRLATVAITIIGFGFSAYLTYRELFSIHAICPWCVSSAVMMTLLVVLAIWRFLRGDQTPTPAIVGGRAPAAAGDPRSTVAS
jgi:uncharacterized membrane protein